MTDDWWESVKCRIVPEALNVRALEALSEQQTGHGPVEKMAWYQVNSKLSESHCLNALSESCKFYRSQQII